MGRPARVAPYSRAWAWIRHVPAVRPCSLPFQCGNPDGATDHNTSPSVVSMCGCRFGAPPAVRKSSPDRRLEAGAGLTGVLVGLSLICLPLDDLVARAWFS